MIKGQIHQEKKKAILNVYIPKIPTKTAKYVKQKLIELKGEFKKSTAFFGDFRIPP